MAGKQKKNPKDNYSAIYDPGQDLRLDFIFDYVMRSLKCKMDKWIKFLTTVESKTVLMDFFEEPEQLKLILYVNSVGMLTVCESYPTAVKTKSCYFIKKHPVSISKEEGAMLKDSLVYGDLSHQILENLVGALEDVISPMISAEMYDEKWPEPVVFDVRQRTQEISGVLRSIQGQLKGKTWLPLPQKLEALILSLDNQDEDDGGDNNCDEPKGENLFLESVQFRSDVESLVIKWSHQISEVFHRDSSDSFSLSTSNKSHPTPSAELQFWEKRVEDLQCIYDQLNSPSILRIGRLLKSTKSKYWRSYNSMYHNVSSSLDEAKAILIYLKPLRRHIEALQLSTFDNINELVRPLMHSVCFLWVYSNHYRTASRIIVLLKSVCNLIIEMARNYMCGSLIFQVEAEEGLLKAKLVVSSLDLFKELYEAHKSALPSYFEEGTEVVEWDFVPEFIFGRYDKFLGKTKKLVSIFETTVEFYKLDKVEIGGSKGKSLGSQIFALYDEFQEYFQKFSSVTYDCSDPEDDSFELDAHSFDCKVHDIDQRLSFVLIQAMEDCHTPESAFKLITVLGSLLQRPVIKQDFAPQYLLYLRLIENDVEMILEQFEDYIGNHEDVNVRVKLRNLQPHLPPYSATIHWIKDAMDRVDTSVRQFQSLSLAIESQPAGQNLLDKYSEFSGIMDDFISDTFFIYSQKIQKEAKGYWTESILKFEIEEVPAVKNQNQMLNQDINMYSNHLNPNPNNNNNQEKKPRKIITVNLNEGLAAIFKEIKYMKMAGFYELPKICEEFDRSKNTFRRNIINLNRICQWYNDIFKDISEVELVLLGGRLEKLKGKVIEGTEKIMWKDFAEITLFIQELSEPMRLLQGQLEKSKENLEKINQLVNQWQNPPLFTRLHSNRFNLLYLSSENPSQSQNQNQSKNQNQKQRQNSKDDEKAKGVINTFIEKRYEKIQKVSREIHRLVQENKQLLVLKNPEGEKKKEKVDDADSVPDSAQVEVETQVEIEKSNELWLKYLDSIDSTILSGLIKTMAVSLGYLIDHTDPHLTPSPFLQVRMQLKDAQLFFDPALESSDDSSFENQIESIISAIYHQAKLIERVRVKKSKNGDNSNNNYHNEIYENEDLQDMHQELISRVRSVIQNSFEYIKQFEKYRYIYEEDKGDHLRRFLQQCRQASQDQREKRASKQQQQQQAQEYHSQQEDSNQNQSEIEEPASLEQFKNAIDTFENILLEVDSFEPEIIIDKWFRLDMRLFKTSFRDQVKGWSLMFKQYLIDSVIGGLSELEKFIKETEAGLSQGVLDGDLQILINVMGLLHKVKQRTPATDVMFKPIKEYIELLKTYDYELPEFVFVLLEDLPEKWIQLKKQAHVTRVLVAPMQASEVSSIRKRIYDFDAKQTCHREMFNECGFFDVNCPFPYADLNTAEKEICELEQEYQGILSAAKLFEVSVPDPRALKQCRKELRLAKSLWDFIKLLEATIDDWKMSPWQKVNAEMMDLECKRMAKEVKSMDKDVKQWPLFLHLEATIRNIISSLKSVSELQNPNIRERHWQELLKSTKIMPRLIDRLIDKFVNDETTTLADLYGLNLHNYEEEVKNVVDKAVKESSMEKILEMLNGTWAIQEYGFEFHPRTGTQLIRVSEDLIEVLEDNQVQLQNIAMSKYIAFFREEVETWQNKLLQADNVLSTVVEVQRTWCHLESIFIATEDIRRNLPEDSARFDNIDKDFKETLQLMYKTKNVIEGTNQPHIFKRLEHIQKELAVCEKALANYLETKRMAFPRFYFVSSADLLDILSSGNDPNQVGRHLTKLFDSLAGLIFTTLEPSPEPTQTEKEQETQSKTFTIAKFSRTAHSMRAKDGEICKFVEDCECVGAVELWLCKLEYIMRATICHFMEISVFDYPTKSREVWIAGYMAQVALCGTQIWWTTEVNSNFTKLEDGSENALKDYYKKQVSQLNTLIDLLLGDLSNQERQKIMTIATIDVHSRDVVGKLIQMRIENAQAFQWQSQLRHRWDTEERDCFSNICDAQLRYLNEYLGNTPRLVITPLTDRCYITLTQSLHLIMGGAPAGPAGTGKTETTKDLGRALGVMVYVFNCSEQMDYKSIGSIFKGLSQTGTWGCFDEFNRITVEVLSVVAVQVKSMQDAIKDKKTRFNFMGEEITMVDTVGIFITMNPGYAGRSELPENLKVLFRPCAMCVPDFELICEIMLVAEGFQDARVLARKFITLYTLCKELLSKQDHYDWGLRAIKSVLVVAGSLKRGDSGRPEDEVLMRALRDFNVPKIISDDIPIFLGLIGDLFPALEVPRKRDIEFETIVKEAAAQLKLQPEENFILKVVQLQELLAVRHSVFILGHAGTGKSKVWKTLYKTYQNMGKKPMYDDLNPKAVTNDELFGIINSQREWRDGILSVLMREQANSTSTDGPKWIILDGDIDPMWIESLNTVMDDNKVLTLASNERIALTKTMRLLFEIYTLKHATPATVSRAGILYLNPQDLGWNAYVTSWISQREDASEKSALTLLFEKYVPSVQEVMRHRFRKVTPIPEINHIQLLCNLLESLLTEENAPPDCPREWIEKYFVFACIWAFGSATFQDQSGFDHRAEFSKWWTSEWKFVAFPAWGTVFDYFIDQETKKLMSWADVVPKFELDTDIPLQATLVHTVETIRIKYFMDLLLDKGHPMMLVGSAGCGKTVLVQDKLSQLPENYAVANVPFNFYTTSEMLQRVLEKPLEKKAGKNFGPVGNKKLVYFIDDLNMPMVDHYETVQPHTLIRQHIDYHHWYDRLKITLKEINNVQYVACMNPTAGSFTINPRLQRHFAVFSVSFPGQESLQSIYQTILSQHIAAQMPISGPIHKITGSIVSAALTLHTRVSQMFIPTASKFHYIFNLRDLSNIFQGILFAGYDCLRTPVDLVRIWMHESARVYGDKLVDDKDGVNFQKFVFDVFKKYFEEMDESVTMAKPLIYYHFALGPGESKYMPVTDYSSLQKFLVESLKSYNEFNSIMNLVLFDAAIHYVCRISRILESPRGNVLLCGVGGSGKQSLARLAAFLSGLDVFQITLTKGYGMQELRTDLAALYLKAGQKNLGTMFLMTDAQVAEEVFLVLINDMLASGEIPDLLPDDEVENVIGAMRSEVKGFGLQDTRENCWKFFIDRVRKVLKCVLCFSPVGSTLRNRSRKFPAVVNCTSIIWFREWPEDALISVSERFVQDIQVLPPSLHTPIASFLAYVHMSVSDMSKTYLANEKRYNYTTPKSYLEQIACYSKLVSQKNNEAISKINRLEQGLVKLDNCAEQVEDLKKVLAEQEVVLKEKNDKADELIKIVGEETDLVTKEKENAAREEANVAIVAEEVAKIQAVCQVELEKAEPALQAAYAALNTLNKINLTELKTFTTPPPDVVNVVGSVFILWEGTQKGRLPRDKSWKVTKSQMMGDVGRFLEGLQNLNKENITPMIVDALRPYISDPGFQPELIRAKSYAASGLCSYVINVLKFNEVYQDVAPKRKALEEATNELNSNLDKLAELKRTIEALEEKLAGLTREFETAVEAKMKCQAEADKTTATIDLANRLVGGLASEKIRWIQNVKIYRESMITIPGDILLVTAFVSYVGSFTKKYRLDLLEKTWVPYLRKMNPGIPMSENVDPLMVLTDEAQIAEWNSHGLPSDRMSSENATILVNSQRWPLMIDPQLQGLKWIKNIFKAQLRAIQLGQKGYLEAIEEEITRGGVVLIENIKNSVDPVLEPLLARNLIKKGTAIKIGDKEVDYNPSFRLILQTKLPNPHYQPEMQAQTTLINFTVTRDGLEDQLLAEVVKVERPDLEFQKSQLTTQQNEFNILLKKLEDDLLSRLQSAEGNFLDDTSLVENLETTKKTAQEVEVKAKEAIITTADIDAAREWYRPAAARASLLYFILNDLNKIHPLYQFSLKAFSTVFHNAIKIAVPSADVKKRTENLIDAITYSVWLYTTRGLFEGDKLIFTAQMVFQIFRSQIRSHDMDFLLRFPAIPNISSPVDFISNTSWGALKSLSQMEDYRGLDRDVDNNPKKWRKFVESESAEKEPFPAEWKTKTGVQRLCIMRCLRPDRMTYAMSIFVEETLGPKYVKSIRLDFAKSFQETSKETPIFFILSPGVDPLKDVESLGKKLNITKDLGNFHNVSLGQGQEVVAEEALSLAGREGHWVILQNIHLVSKWLPKLEKKLERNWLDSKEDYRVFLSAEPASTHEGHIIPQGILESSIKITNEAPTGMKNNIHKALDNFSQETLETCTKELEFKAILFSLCYFHAVVAERRKFGTQGWNKKYPFNTGDLTISVNVLFNYLEANSKVPWEDLRYLFGEIMYGGHITDDWDRKLCRTYLEEFMVQELLDGEIEYAPGFPAPPSTDFSGYHQYIDELLPPESPYLYGLHPNAEIGFLTATSDTLFRTILELQPRDSGADGGAASSKEDKVKQILEEIIDRLPDPFNMVEVNGRAEEKTPYVIVALQECERMNSLTILMRTTLKELELGLKGELTITGEMEDLSNSLFMDQVPPAWLKRSYPSTLGLGSWYADLLLRVRDLDLWTNDFLLPPAVWLSGFFNPQSFLTAIMQSTARRQELPLDKMCLQCDVTKKNKEETTSAPKEGACIHGLFMEGARWDMMQGCIAESRSKELYPPMPVIFLKAITQDKQDIRNMYECPVYKTRARGLNYVWTFNLKTRDKPSKWVLSGVAILLQV